MHRRTAWLAVAVAIALAVSACSDGGGDPRASEGVQAETDAPAVESPPTDLADAVPSDDASGGSVGSPTPQEEEPAAAVALLAEGSSVLAGRAVRGVAMIAVPEIEGEAPFELTSRFESDADGDLSVRIEIEPGMDPQFPDGGVAEIRYAGREAYVRMTGAAGAPAAVQASVDADGRSAWFVAASESSGDPRWSEGIAALLCVLPQLNPDVSWGCAPLSSVAALLATASGATAAGSDTIREVPTTRVEFRVPLTGLYPASFVDELEETLEARGDALANEDLEQLSELLRGIVAEAWIDGSGLVRRLVLDLLPVQLIVEFYDFDADIAVDAPPPEQVAGELPLFDGAGGGGSAPAGSDSGSAEPAGPPPAEPPGPGEDVSPPSGLAEPSRAAPLGCPPPDGSGPRYFDFDGPQPTCIDPGARYVAVFDTSEGEMRFELTAADTPGTVNNFVTLARWGYYHHTLLFRTDPSIDIIQGGSPHTNSASDPGPGYTIPDEPAFDVDPATGQPSGPYRYEPGQLVMARSSGLDSAGAQFFITTGPNASRLDSQGTYVVFGSTDAAGLAVAQSIIGLHVAGGSLGGEPSRPVIVRSVTIEETPAGRLASDFTNAALCTAAGFTWSEQSASCN